MQNQHNYRNFFCFFRRIVFEAERKLRSIQTYLVGVYQFSLNWSQFAQHVNKIGGLIKLAMTNLVELVSSDSL